MLAIEVESSVVTPVLFDLGEERKAEKDPEFWIIVPLDASSTRVACTPGFLDNRAKVSAKASAPLP